MQYIQRGETRSCSKKSHHLLLVSEYASRKDALQEGFRSRLSVEHASVSPESAAAANEQAPLGGSVEPGEL